MDRDWRRPASGAWLLFWSWLGSAILSGVSPFFGIALGLVEPEKLGRMMMVYQGASRVLGLGLTVVAAIALTRLAAVPDNAQLRRLTWWAFGFLLAAAVISELAIVFSPLQQQRVLLAGAYEVAAGLVTGIAHALTLASLYLMACHAGRPPHRAAALALLALVAPSVARSPLGDAAVFRQISEVLVLLLGVVIILSAAAQVLQLVLLGQLARALRRAR